MTILVFILDYYHEKLNFFQNIQKTYIWVISEPFCPKLGKNEFTWKKGLNQFLNIPIIYHRAKSQKNIISDYSKKCQTDVWSERQTDNSEKEKWAVVFIEDYHCATITKIHKAT